MFQFVGRTEPFLFTLIGFSTVFAEENQKLSVSLDFLNTSSLVSLNAEYSPNQYFDFGMGITPFSYFILPEVEVHFFARTCFLNYFIQPYIQLGTSLVAPVQINSNENWLNARVGAGVKFSFVKNFYCGLGGNYNFLGQNLVPLSWYGFSPSVFVGYTAIRF